jgi:thioredoxin reductase
MTEMPMRQKKHEVVIIGAGPAGIAAAIQLQHHGIKPVVFEGNRIGGLLNNANRVENYPGFPHGIAGTALVRLFKKQAERAVVTIRHEAVIRVSFSKGSFHIATNGGAVISKILVVASGTRPKPITGCHVPVNARRKIHYEVWPIRHIANKRAAIIGGGDAAFDYALNLARRNKVTILSRSDRTKCLPGLREQAARHKNIVHIANTRVLWIALKRGVLILNCSNKRKITADHLLVATGREPQLEFLSRAVIKNKWKLARQKKLYIIGDVRNRRYRQTAIAVGDGARAGMEIAGQIAEEQRS